MRKQTIIINGYGVPKDIMTDLSYHAYLIQIFNFLWENFRSSDLLIIPCGGLTDMFPPYKRTEAGEITKWLKYKINKLRLSKKWRLQPIATELTALENMLACKKRIKNAPLLYFCEKTRERKMRILAKKIFGNKTKIIGVEFDGSAPRYQTPGRKTLEERDLKYSLLGLANPIWRKMLQQAAIDKINILRKTPEKIRAVEIDKITRRIRDDYYKIFKNKGY